MSKTNRFWLYKFRCLFGVFFFASFYFLVFIVVYSLPERYIKHFVIAIAIILTIFLKIGIRNNFLVLLNSRVEFLAFVI